MAADAEFALNAADGARENAKKAGLKVVYDRRYPPNTTDFAPIVRAIAATNPDIVVVCSYPPDSVGIVRSVNELNFRPKMIGGAMVGPQNTSIKAQLGPLLNGWTNYDFWLPVPKMNFPGVGDMMAKYQKRAPAEGIDPYGYYMAPQAYAQYQVLEQAVDGDQEPQRRDARRLHPQEHVQDGARRHQVRQGRRMGGVARAAGAVPRHQEQRPGAVQGHRAPGRWWIPAGYGQSDKLVYPYEKAQSLTRHASLGPTPGSDRGAARTTARRHFLRQARTACG